MWELSTNNKLLSGKVITRSLTALSRSRSYNVTMGVCICLSVCSHLFGEFKAYEARCLMGVTRVSPVCFWGVTRVFYGRFISVLRIFWGCFIGPFWHLAQLMGGQSPDNYITTFYFTESYKNVNTSPGLTLCSCFWTVNFTMKLNMAPTSSSASHCPVMASRHWLAHACILEFFSVQF